MTEIWDNQQINDHWVGLSVKYIKRPHPSCYSPGYSVRSYIGDSNCGGINTASYSGPTRTMTVRFQY
jgi:hypothetical protein